jgi:hypothetical protein
MKRLTLDEFNKERETRPYAYLVAFVVEGATGSLVSMHEQEVPLYELYFMFDSMNTDGKAKIIVTNIIKLT